MPRSSTIAAIGVHGQALLAVVGMLAIIALRPAEGCSVVFWNDNGVTAISGRTFDWEHNFKETLWIMPRGVRRSGRAGDNSAAWTSKYGSIVVAALDIGTSERLNERGLAVHLLYQAAGSYEPRDHRPGVSTLLWVQYHLDNFATVDEALAHLNDVQIVSVPIASHADGLPLHIAIEDKTGNSAVIEFINGRMIVHAGRQYRVMTNEPAYDEQLSNLARYKDFGGTVEALPGNILPMDRFVRAAYFLKYLPKPENAEVAAAYLLSLVNNISVPFGAPYIGVSGTYPTWWRTLSDLGNGVFYFSYALSPSVIWVDLKQVDFSQGVAARQLHALDAQLVGDVSKNFVAATAPF
jgi:penicillin V acylase-like amidase (Ntn superfamily)